MAKAIDKPLMIALRTEIDKAIAEIGNKHGVQLKLGSGRYSNENAEFKLGVAVVQDGGLVMCKEATLFQPYATMWGMKPEDLGKTFTHHNGHRYQIVGAKPRSKHPVLCKDLTDGLCYKLAETYVAQCLK